MAFVICGLAVAGAVYYLMGAGPAPTYVEEPTPAQLEYEALMEKSGGDMGKLTEDERARLMEIKARPDAPVGVGG